MSALIYQIVWIKMLGQVFGLTIFAVSTVLTAFMAGLALGSYFFGKLIDRVKDHLLVFLFLELGIGVFALLFPPLLQLFSGIYVSVAMITNPGLYANSILRFAISFLLLLVPTTLMGGTLPV
jgi:spermidine synthase